MPFNIEKIVLRTHLIPFCEYSKENYENEFFKKSLYISSKNFYTELLAFEQKSEKDKNKILKSLRKFWARSVSRCTPFGLFAGIAVIDLENESSFNTIYIGNTETHRQALRLDADFLKKLINHILYNEEAFKYVQFYLNNSVYEVGSFYRYVEYNDSVLPPQYELVSVEKTNILCEIVGNSKLGISFSELVELIQQTEEVNYEESAQFVMSLITSGFLSSELEPTITGTSMLDSLIISVQKYSALSTISENLKQIKYILSNSTKESIEYENIEKEIKRSLKVDLSYPTLQVDTYLKIEKNSSLDKKIITTILNQVKSLKVLGRAIDLSEINDFKKKFINRYGDEEVPLSIVLDPEIGIGFGNNKSIESDLIDNLTLGSSEKKDSEQYYFDFISEFITNKYIDFVKGNDNSIEITESDINLLKKKSNYNKRELTKSIFGSLFIGSDDFSFELKAIGGTSSTYTLSRFANGDQAIEDYTKILYNHENKVNSNFVVAEIVHLPEDRAVGNIVQRPILSKYEIPYVSKSGILQENQLEISDLIISVISDKIYIKSKKLSKFVIPKLTTAHSYKYNSLPVYRFLSELQQQENLNFGIWDWGILRNEKYLPRVQYKNLIVKKARWILEYDIVFSNSKNTHITKIELLKIFLNKNNIPSDFFIEQGEEEIFINTNYSIGDHLLLDFLEKYKKIFITENLLNRSNSIVKDLDGNYYSNEIVIPFFEKDGGGQTTKMLQKINVESSYCTPFTPQSEWMYFKIYAGNLTLENLLSTKIGEYVNSLLKERKVEKFFFIRYKDSENHLRLRFFNSKKNNKYIFDSFQQLFKEEVEEGIIHNITIDSYKREINRYNKKFIDKVETLFFADSIAIIDIISILKQVEDSQRYRVLFALRGIDFLLDDFKFSIYEKKEFLEMLTEVFLKEFGDAPILKKQLNSKYRGYQSDIFSHMNPGNDISNNIHEVVEIFKLRSRKLDIITDIITDVDFQKNKFQYISSYIHMFVNRIMISDHRKNELVLYYFLSKYYNSIIAIGNASN